MEKNFYAVIVAGGSGTRMGGSVPKQFLPLGGEPILRRTIERFRKALPGAVIVTVLPKDSIPMWEEYSLLRFPDCPQMIVEGGITRFHSVRAALAKIPDGVTVAVHDGVRPFVSEGLIRRMAEKMSSERALVPVMGVTDTLKCLEKGSSGLLSERPGPAPDRSRLYAAQTPQMFRSEDLKAAYGRAYDTSFTDDASVVRAAGIPVSYIEGEKYNIKITTPEDLPLAEFLYGRPTAPSGE